MPETPSIPERPTRCLRVPLQNLQVKGWMHHQMQHDLKHGFLGHLPELVPALFQDDIYFKDRLTLNRPLKNLGVVAEEAEWQVQYQWWNSETQSNHLDGFIRTAHLVGDTEAQSKAALWVERLLATQDADGYLGIYSPELRFNLTGENGELWAQATLLRALLGFFEATGDQRVLQAVVRAVHLTMQCYPMQDSAPFRVEGAFAGVCHGLAFTDVLDLLYQHTFDVRYLEYAHWLYQSYSESPLMERDIQQDVLLQREVPFAGHTVHTTEHLRSLLTALTDRNSPELQLALRHYLQKLDRILTPSGAPIGDEFIEGREATVDRTGYEYCSLHELLHSYGEVLHKSQDLGFADRMEWLLFNAAQGSRHPQKSSIAYLKTDTSVGMKGHLPGVVSKDVQLRYKYSVAHQDVAVCCVPNAGRIHAHHLQYMWWQEGVNLSKLLYGDSVLKTTLEGVGVRIEETSNYPFETCPVLKVQVKQPLKFTLKLRVPSWCKGVNLQVPEGITVTENDQMLALQGLWQGESTVRVRFDAQPEITTDRDGRVFFRHGPLMYVRPIAAQEKEGKTYLAGFTDILCNPLEEVQDWEVTDGPIHLEIPAKPGYQNPPALQVNLRSPRNGEVKVHPLLPLGSTTLRQATFHCASRVT